MQEARNSDAKRVHMTSCTGAEQRKGDPVELGRLILTNLTTTTITLEHYTCV